jgi:hypothetical protein
MNVIFFTPIPETKRLATVVTDADVKSLKLEGVIPSKSRTLIAVYDENDSDLMMKIYFIEYMKFDNYASPKNIVPDIDLFSMAALEDIRTKRLDLFLQLDSLQTRAHVTGRADLVAEMEKDKKSLRDLTDKFQTSECESVLDVYRAAPIELFIDYEEKYAEKFRQQY